MIKDSYVFVHVRRPWHASLTHNFNTQALKDNVCPGGSRSFQDGAAGEHRGRHQTGADVAGGAGAALGERCAGGRGSDSGQPALRHCAAGTRLEEAADDPGPALARRWHAEGLLQHAFWIPSRE